MTISCARCILIYRTTGCAYEHVVHDIETADRHYPELLTKHRYTEGEKMKNSIIEKAIYSKGLQHKNANARKFPEDIELEICDKYRNGMSIIQLSNEYHASQTTIRNILCLYKLK